MRASILLYILSIWVITASSMRWSSIVPACIDGHNDRVVNGTRDIDACLELCENYVTFRCLSIEYKDGVCNLSKYGQFTLALASDYQQPCSDAGWLYAERFESDDDSCDDPWSPVRNACIEGHNGKVLADVESVQDCKDLCMRESTFVCLSFDYNDARSCYLSRVNQHTVNPKRDYQQPCSFAGNVYAERRDLGHWTATVHGCIRGHNDQTVHEVEDLDACKELCMQEQSFLCRSVDLDGHICYLSRWTQDTVTPPADYTRPCYSNPDTTEYAERYWTK